MNTFAANNAALDAIAQRNDAQQGERVLAQVFSYIGRFVAYPSDHAQVAHALWCVHTHLMDKWESTPRLAFLSAEPASGKTRAMEVTEPLVPSPVAAVNVSPAYLFRKVGSEEGVTILFDEIDTVFGPKAKENEEIRGLLNAGHRRDAVAGRCVMHGKTVMTEEIPAYAPVALAGLGWLPDTILSRSVIVRMQRRHQGEQVEQFRHRIHAPQGHKVRTLVETWAKTVAGDIDWPDMPAGVEDRDADVWEPLIAVADLVGGHWPDRARAAAVAFIGESKQAAPSLGVQLLADLKLIFDHNDKPGLPSKVILDALHGLEESPWKDIRGKPIDERGLARRLRDYSIRSTNIAWGNSRPKGYHYSDFADAWVRYLPSLPPPDKSATSATCATGKENQAEKVADEVADVADAVRLALPKNPHKSLAVADVAEVADLPGIEGQAVCACCGQPEADADALLTVDDGIEAHVHRGCLPAWRERDPLEIPYFLRRHA